MANDEVPGYWMHETSGELAPVVKRYLEHQPMGGGDITIMRAYLRQWINAPAWRGAAVDDLRRRIDTLTTRSTIDAWLHDALDAGIDPL